MTKVILALWFLAGIQAATGQTAQKTILRKSDCAPVTQRMIEQVFTLEKQLQLQNDPQELACLDYLCARSYEFAPGQPVLRSQKALFNIEKYKDIRRVDQRVTVYDETSGLQVVIYSWNEVESALISIRTSYQLAACD